MKTDLLMTACFLILFSTQAAFAQQTLRVATIIPDTFWAMRQAREAFQEVEKKTEKKLRFDIFTGGIQGDEAEIVAKLDRGELEGAFLIVVALSELFPEMTVFALPFLIQDESQARRARDKFRMEMEQLAAKRGLVLLTWRDAGLARIFSRFPIRSPEDMKKHRVWSAETEFLSKWVEGWAGSVVPLPLLKVRDHLAAGKLDTVLNTALGLAIYGWHLELSYMLDADIAYVYVVCILRKDAYDRLAPESRSVLMSVVRSHESKINDRMWADDRAAVVALQKRGLQLVTPSADVLKVLKQTAEEHIKALGDRYFPADLLNRVKAELAR